MKVTRKTPRFVGQTYKFFPNCSNSLKLRVFRRNPLDASPVGVGNVYKDAGQKEQGINAILAFLYSKILLIEQHAIIFAISKGGLARQKL